MIRVTDTWRGASRGTPEEAKAYFRKVGSLALRDADDAADETYRLARLTRLDAALLISHMANESGDKNRGGAFLDGNWATTQGYRAAVNRYNGAGMGVTDSYDYGYRFAGGREFAQAFVVHHAAYEIPKNDPAWEVLKPYIKLDPRYDDIPSRNRGTVRTVADMNGKWWTNPSGAQAMIDRGNEIFPTIPNQGKEPPVATDKVTFGNVPMFGYLDRQSVTASKPEGAGWDNLGKRDVLGVVLHRMLGSLTGTDQYFRGSTPALTDYGMGVAAQDGKALAGVIYKWNDEYGYRSGWASGRVSAPYGDGLIFVNKYGVNAVNKRLVSIETSGFENTAIDDFAWGELVHFVAWYADQAKISWEDFPIYSVTGASFLFWHQEFCIGTGKKCPFNVLMSRTNELIADVKVFLKKYQVGSVTVPPVVTIPPGEVPTPIYAEPKPIKGLALLADVDFKGQKAYTDAEGTRFRIVLDTVRVVDPKNFYRQRLAKTAPITKPDPKKDDVVPVIYSFLAADGKTEGYIDPQWARIFADQVVLEED